MRAATRASAATRTILLPTLLLAAFIARSGAAQAPDAPSSSSVTAPVEAQLAAYNAHDLEAFLAPYAPDVRLYDFPDRLVGEGLGTMRETYGDLFARAPGLRAEVTSRHVSGRFVLDRERVMPAPGVAPVEATVIYEVTEGKITRVWFVH